MDTHKPEPIDPLRRVFLFNGDRFKTHDGIAYRRDETGAIRRQIAKQRGKTARRTDKAKRRA